MFGDSGLEDYTSTAPYYMKECVVNDTIDSSIHGFPNQKSWIIKEIRTVLKNPLRVWKQSLKLLEPI